MHCVNDKCDDGERSLSEGSSSLYSWERPIDLSDCQKQAPEKPEDVQHFESRDAVTKSLEDICRRFCTFFMERHPMGPNQGQAGISLSAS